MSTNHLILISSLSLSLVLLFSFGSFIISGLSFSPSSWIVDDKSSFFREPVEFARITRVFSFFLVRYGSIHVLLILFSRSFP